MTDQRTPPSPWPLFELALRTPRLELRSPTDADLMELVELVRAGIHDPSWMPFLVPWTDLPSPELERSFLRFMWRCRAEWSPDDWRLPLVVREQGRAVGVQELRGLGFPTTRSVETGSWLGRASQGRGIGTEMRAAVLHLAFEGLGAETARSGAMANNAASARVAEKLGYEEVGTAIVAPRGVPVVERQFQLSRQRWRPTVTVTIDGLEPCLELLGATW
jgi:RimJ/RimL family protein N-acetyltransferase